ncbi:MAG: 4Fe-4S dicluster domain-containing protein [Candidatus Heimdallarchaeota archaeon]|nr:4Fe-4S dicluster domain-containing protein [Candidatus Heimdallarchaeota archaeon]
MSYDYIEFGETEKEFTSKIEEISGQNIFSCYQCGKCSAGCAFSNLMEKTINHTMQLVQLGKKEKVLQSNTHWVCASCLTCTVRCPREIDVAAVMEAIREYTLRYESEKIERLDLPEELLKKIPNIALVGSFRKKSEL